jgi:tetratricopeptide (TPR) repeat protein
LAWSLLGLAANLAGDRELGTAAHARAREINPRNDWRTLVGEGSKEWAEAVLREPVEALDPVIRAARVQAFRFLGREAAARAELDELISCCSFTGAWQIAFTYERAGERDKAFEWLERARLHMDGGIRNLKLAQRYKGDPRTAEILKKMNLPLD